jgi:hypothetical protein
MYYCSVCQINKNKEPIFKYNIESHLHNICAYGCWCSRNKIVYNWNSLINKDDFTKIPLPHVETPCKFKLLTDGELDQMTNIQVSSYLKNLDDYLLLNPIRKEIQLSELSNEDTHLSDEYESDDSLNICDDY